MSEATPAVETPPKRLPIPGLKFIFLTMLLDVLGFGLAIPVMPKLVTELSGGGLSQGSGYYGLLMSLYTLVQFLCAPLLGALSDRYGRKPVLLLSLLTSVVAYLITAASPSLGWLMFARALGGLGGASITVASTYIADITPPERRAEGFGMSGAAFGLGFILGPALGGLLGGLGLRVPFYVAAGVAGLNFLYGLFLLPESHQQHNRRAFRFSAINPVSWVAHLRRYPYVAGMATALLWYGLANQCLQSNWVPYTTYRFNWPFIETGLSLTAVGLSVVIVQGGLVRHILPRLGERNAVAFGLAVNGTALALYGVATATWQMFVILACSAIGGVAGPAAQAQMSKQVPPSEQGAVQGALTSMMSLTGIVGPLLANGLFSYYTAPEASFKLPGVAMFLGAFCSLGALLSVLRVFARFPEQAAPVFASEQPGEIAVS